MVTELLISFSWNSFPSLKHSFSIFKNFPALMSMLSIIMSILNGWLLKEMPDTDLKKTVEKKEPGVRTGQGNSIKWKHWWLHSTFIAVGGFESESTHWSMNANCGPNNPREAKACAENHPSASTTVLGLCYCLPHIGERLCLLLIWSKFSKFLVLFFFPFFLKDVLELRKYFTERINYIP